MRAGLDAEDTEQIDPCKNRLLKRSLGSLAVNISVCYTTTDENEYILDLPLRVVK